MNVVYLIYLHTDKASDKASNTSWSWLYDSWI